MFCFPSPSQRKTKSSSGLSDFSQSVSALTQLPAASGDDNLSNMCRSDTNISSLSSFSLLKSAVKIKSILSRSSRDVSEPNSASKMESVSAECVLDTQEASVKNSPVKNAISDTCLNEKSDSSSCRKDEISFIDTEDTALVLKPKHSVHKNKSSPNPGEILTDDMPKSRLARPPDIIHSREGLSIGIANDGQSSSGNSSTSDGIAPMASPEYISPPESGVSSPVALEHPEITSPAPRPRYQLITEGDVQVCRLNHTRTIVSKVLSSKFLRRWENHHVILTEAQLTSRSPTGFLDQSVPYSQVQDVYAVQRWDNKFCIRLVLTEGSLLLQANSSFVRDQWEHSIKWMIAMHKYRCILRKSSRPEVILNKIKVRGAVNLVEFAVSSPVQDESALSVPIEIISSLLDEEELWENRSRREEVMDTMAPLLDNTSPTIQMCQFFSKHCYLHPRSPVIANIFTPIVHRILKRNVDFAKSPYMRRFIADFVRAVHSQNNGEEAIQAFVRGVHGIGMNCPHPRVLPNLVAAALAAIFAHYETRRAAPSNETDQAVNDDNPLKSYLTLFLAISELEGWRPGLAALLHPVPLPDEALSSSNVMSGLADTILRIGTDSRCEVHSMTLGIRPGKEGWLHAFCPSSPGCHDGGALWCQILETLVNCCCRRKSFLLELAKQVGALQLMALRDHNIAHDLLCLMLEWNVATSEELQLQIVTTLESTESGRSAYKGLVARQDHLKQLQQKGGPRKLTLPSRSTDADVAKLLSTGSLGNLECLSLAFTHVTSACAQYLIQLPALRYLNLWATQFGDVGLQVIADHLDRLQVLNLCETPVTDKGIASIVGMTSLKKLNLNSTKLSLETLEKIKAELPGLQELDVRYTDAW